MDDLSAISLTAARLLASRSQCIDSPTKGISSLLTQRGAQLGFDLVLGGRHISYRPSRP